MKQKSKKIRVQLDMSTEEVHLLDSLRETCGLHSRSDAVRTALSVIDWVSREAKQGHRIVSLGGSVMSELVMPGVTLSPRK